MKSINPNLTEDPISQLFFRIAIPSSIGTVFMTLYNIVDTYFAGKISPEALAALAQTFPVYFIIIAMAVGLSIGTTSLILSATSFIFSLENLGKIILATISLSFYNCLSSSLT